MTPLVGPSILAADFARLAEECRSALDGGADFLHLDVMDGHFVPNLTMGPALCASLRQALPNTPFDVHMMVADPAAYIEPFARAGADLYTIHVEATGDERAAAMAAEIHDTGMLAGIAINPPTAPDEILPIIDEFDLVLVMSVHPGFAGQAFIPEVLEKARAIRPRLRPNQRLEIDGGVNASNAIDCRDAGCDALVAASAVFKAADRAEAIGALRGSAYARAQRTEAP